MSQPRTLQRIRDTLPSGSFTLGAGVALYGLTAYGFLIVAARALGPVHYASLSVFWAMIYLLAPGLFLPLEQELSRVVAARRVAGRALLGRAAFAGAAVATVLVGLSVLAWRPVLQRLFDDNILLLAGLGIGLFAYAAQHLTRGVLAGSHEFVRFSLVLGTEGILRLAAAGGLAALGVAAAGPYGLLVGLAPLLSVAAASRPLRKAARPGPSAPWSELTRALGFLLASSLLAQYLAVAAPVAVKLLAGPGEEVEAGRMLASLVVTRIPLFLFQAVQPPLLAKLSALVGTDQTTEYRAGVLRILAVVTVIGAATVIGALAIGPLAVRLLFGSAFALGRVDLLYLAAGTAAYMFALALAQALIAASLHARVALGWLVGGVIFTMATALGDQLLLRVEIGFLLGAIGAAVAMAAGLATRMRELRPDEEGTSLAPVVIEP